jgi:hypothetical protein
MDRLRRAYVWAERADSFLGVVERAVVVGAIGLAGGVTAWTLLGGDLLRLVGAALVGVWVVLAAVLVLIRFRRRRPRTGPVARRTPQSDPSAYAIREVGPFGPLDLVTEPKPGLDIPVHYRGEHVRLLFGLITDPSRTIYTGRERASELVATGMFSYGERPDTPQIHVSDSKSPQPGPGKTRCQCGWVGPTAAYMSHVLEASRGRRQMPRA